MVKLIEMVCTGNNGRSPVAELIARNYLNEVGATEDYQAISSGTLVDQISKGGFPLKIMIPIIDLGKQRELYNPRALAKLETAIEAGDAETVEKYFNETVKTFLQEEVEYRGELLSDLGIRGSVKQGKDQTIPRENAVAVLPVDKANYPKVLGIYSDSGYTPAIAVLSILATGDLEAQVANAFGLGKDVYRQRLEQLAIEVPIAVGRIIGA